MKLLLLTLAAALANAQDQSQQELLTQSQAVLGRAREQVIHTTESLPRYVCLENIERAYLDPVKAILPKQNSCPAIENKSSPNLRLKATDRVHLEVAVSDGGELDSWPQTSRFDTRGIDIVESGPISSGAFGSNLAQIFQNPGAKFQFTGTSLRGGRRVFVYRYAVPLETSEYMVRLLDGVRLKTSYSGEVEIVADTAELISVTLETDLLSPFSGMCRARTVNVYHRVKVGNGEFLIPVTSTLLTIRPDGTATESTTTFSGCHEYTVEATIHFDSGDDATPQTAPKTPETKPIPSAIKIGLRLDAPIDTGNAAAGDIVWARIDKSDRKPKAQKFLPSGARVEGRILQAMHNLGKKGGFDIEFTFDAFQVGSKDPIPFAGVAVPGKLHVPRLDASLQGAPTGGVFKIRTQNGQVIVPAGTYFEWLTQTPPKPKD